MIIKPVVIVQSATIELDAAQLQELAACAAPLEAITTAYAQAGADLDNGHDARLAAVRDLRPLRELVESVQALLNGAAVGGNGAGKRGRRRVNPTNGG